MTKPESKTLERASEIAERSLPKRPKLTPEEIALGAHNIVLGEWACPGCGRVAVASDYPFGRGCPGCGRPYPSRCLGCKAFIDPTPTPSGWNTPDLFCAPCTHSERIEFRSERLLRSLDEDLHGYLDYHPWAHRKKADVVIDRWLRSGFGSGPDTASKTPFLLITGEIGSGKSTAAAMALNRAYVDLQMISSFWWVTEGQLLDTHKAAWGDTKSTEEQGVKDESKATLRKLKSVELLIVDEFLGEITYSESFLRLMSEMITSRRASGRPTIFTSNAAGNLCGKQYSERVQDRFNSSTYIVDVSGMNLRMHYRSLAKRKL